MLKPRSFSYGSMYIRIFFAVQVERRGTGHTSLFLDERQVESGVKGRETRKETRERGSEEGTLEMGDKMKRGERMRDEIRDTSEIRAENGSLEDGRELGRVG
jgi:hypothetical protein